MTKIHNRLKEISDELNEHIIAVRGTLELVVESVSKGELNDLLLKATDRMDAIQRLSNEMIEALKHILAKMDELKNAKIQKGGEEQGKM